MRGVLRTIGYVLVGGAVGAVLGYCTPFLVSYGIANEFVARHAEPVPGQLIVPAGGVAVSLFFTVFYTGVILGGFLGLVFGIRATRTRSSGQSEE